VSGCSESDENSADLKNSIIGIWKPVKRVEVCSTGNEEVYVGSVCEQKTRTEFTQNGTWTSIIWREYNSGCEEYRSKVGTYTINDNIMTLIDQNYESNQDSEVEIYKIIELSANILKLEKNILIFTLLMMMNVMKEEHIIVIILNLLK